jgi:hypothetical protein
LHQTGEEFIDENGQKAKARKKTGNKWFETQDQIAYYQEFEKEKVVWGQFQDGSEYSLAPKGFTLSSNEYMLCGDYNRKFFLGLLNSKIVTYYLRMVSNSLGESSKIFQKSVFETIPIPKLSEEEQLPFEQLVEQILALKEQGKDTTDLENQIDQLVYQLYGLTEEEIKIIENN